MTNAFSRLRDFLDRQMRMSHIYQPVMLEVLLASGGVAGIREIVVAILAHDESQIDYYEEIVKRMPGRVLSSHGIVERHNDTYRLTADIAELTEDERADLLGRCRKAVEEFKARRGDAIWQHRAPGLGVIPGKLRYETLKRAAFRCELCGVSADERALDVDHILPKAAGGTDDSENLQALCWLCNTNKGAGDDADFREIGDSYALREDQCPFCIVRAGKLLAENSLAFLIADGVPVTEGHLLAIPRRHVADYFDLHQPERNALQRLLDEGRKLVGAKHPDVSGFNVGINCGEAAGQTIFHCHVHLIPRRVGDVANPRGGVRAVIAGKQDYTTAV
jgi:diadenosine tetraphosphate (Ap4A) HIT family hydrolase